MLSVVENMILSTKTLDVKLHFIMTQIRNYFIKLMYIKKNHFKITYLSYNRWDSRF